MSTKQVIFISRMCIAHTAKVMFQSFCPSVHKGGGVSGKVHYEHILATKVLMPVGGGGGVSGKIHYSGNVPGNEHILGLPARGMQIDIRIAFLFDYPYKVHIH